MENQKITPEIIQQMWSILESFDDMDLVSRLWAALLEYHNIDAYEMNGYDSDYVIWASSVMAIHPESDFKISDSAEPSFIDKINMSNIDNMLKLWQPINTYFNQMNDIAVCKFDELAKLYDSEKNKEFNQALLKKQQN